MTMLDDIERLKKISKEVRIDVLHSVKESNGGHIGGSLSVTDILVALYFSHLKFDASNPGWADRDRFILSKGHCCLPLYHILAKLGFFPESWTKGYCTSGGELAGHVEHCVPGIELTSGSLGHGASVGVGMALAAKRRSLGWHTYVVLGDGECNEGSVWEAFMAASQWELSNLHFIIDYNKQESLDHIDNIMSLEPLVQRCESFGLETHAIDGHDHQQLFAYLQNLKTRSKPTMLIANTVKGKGVSFMEKVYKWHYSRLDNDNYKIAIDELNNA